MPRVEITSLAEEDLYQIWHFIAIRRHNPENAERFIDELTEQFYGLAKIPEIGSRKRELHTKLYLFPFRSYLIFYRIIPQGIEVVRVLHGARNIPDLL